MTAKMTTEQLIKWASIAFIAQILLTSAHHLYGGMVYESTIRLAMPIFGFVELLIVLGLLYWYRRSRTGIALGIYSAIATLVGVVQGGFHSLYGHLYRDILALIGVPAETVRGVFFPVLPNDFVYPPNDVFFEATGILQILTVYFVGLLTYRLIQSWRLERKTGSNPAANVQSGLVS